MVEERIAVVEEQIKTLQKDITELKSDIKEIKHSVSENTFATRIGRSVIWALSVIGTGYIVNLLTKHLG